MNNSTVALIIVVLIAVVGGYYFFANSGSNVVPVQSPTTETATTPVTPTENTSSTAEAAVSIQNFSFNPSTLSIKTGTKVTWTNNDSVPHTVTTDSGALLDSKSIAPGASFSFTFAAPGTNSYHCAVHPMMKGSVTVGS